MDPGYINPCNDTLDIVAFPYDVLGIHGSHALHSEVIVLNPKGTVVQCVTGAGQTRTLQIVTVGEQLPCFIESFTAATTALRIRIFFN